jgi:hypothetical protein
MLNGSERLMRLQSESDWQPCSADEAIYPLFYRRIGQSTPERILQIGDRSYYRCREVELELLFEKEGVSQNYQTLDAGEDGVTSHLQALAEALSV